MTTMRDVGARAGVSAKTVSRVLRNDRYVTDEVRGRVLAAVAELKYVPNALAVSFRSGQDAAIGVAVPDIADPFFAALVKSVELEARRRGAAAIVTSVGDEPEREREVVESLLKRQIRGLVCCPVSSDQSYLRDWQARTQVVCVDRAPQRLVADAVVEDDFGGGEAMTTHLLGHGHRRIAFLGDRSVWTTTTLRLEGYRSAFAKARRPVLEELVHVFANDPATVHEVLANLRGLDAAPTALFSSNGRLSMEVVRALTEIGWDDVAVVSFGDFPMAPFLRRPMTVIDQDPGAVGRTAVERLFQRIESPERRLKRRVVLPVGLIERESCHLP